MKELIQKIGHKINILCDEAVEKGIIAGISYYDELEFPEAQAHTFPEVYYVEAGNGELLLGEEKKKLSPGQAFIIPEHVPHTIRCSGCTGAVKIFWIQLHNKER